MKVLKKKDPALYYRPYRQKDQCLHLREVHVVIFATHEIRRSIIDRNETVTWEQQTSK